MRILVLSHSFPYPPFDGDVLPIYHFLRCLAPRVEYTLLTTRPADDEQWFEGCGVFEEWGIHVVGVAPRPRGKLAQTLACLRHGRPWANRFFSPELAFKASELINHDEFHYCGIHSEGILSAQHLPRRHPGGSVLIARDCRSLAHWRAWRHTHRPRELALWLKIRQMEAALYARADRIMAISPTDRAAMLRIRPGAQVGLLPNGVDLAQFRPAPEREEAGLVAFSGAMDYPPNIDGALWLAREVWPRVRRRRPGARLMLAGRDPVAEVRALAAADDSIEVTGRVPAIQDWLARAEVIAAPLRHGTGMKNKVLEGAALGKAMVVTPVSLEDIELAPGRELVLAEGAEAFAEAIAALLEDRERRRELGAAARRAVETKYAWEAMAERLWACYREIATK